MSPAVMTSLSFVVSPRSQPRALLTGSANGREASSGARRDPAPLEAFFARHRARLGAIDPFQVPLDRQGIEAALREVKRFEPASPPRSTLSVSAQIT